MLTCKFDGSSRAAEPEEFIKSQALIWLEQARAQIVDPSEKIRGTSYTWTRDDTLQ